VDPGIGATFARQLVGSGADKVIESAHFDFHFLELDPAACLWTIRDATPAITPETPMTRNNVCHTIKPENQGLGILRRMAIAATVACDMKTA
jgi:hypothetical protein